MKRNLLLVLLVGHMITARAQTTNPAPYCTGSFDSNSNLFIDSVGFQGNTFISMYNPSGSPAYAGRYTNFTNKQVKLLRGTS